ncbi:MAG: type II secretion system secretin GspD [Xanthomonadales bacterium]|nr:Type II secretion system protein D [Xanthomonadales bacterium]MCC6593688.1 type II secretion system secretin GspD [Xanthomonadales bacterium]
MTNGFRPGAFALTCLILVGCAGGPFARPDAGPETADSAQRERVAEVARAMSEEEDAAPTARTATAGKPAEAAAETKEGDVRQPGNGRLIDLEAARVPAHRPPEKGKASLNFADLPIADVVKMILGDLLGENYIIAAGVSGTVTFSTARPVTPEQAFSILEMLLSWNNLALVYVDGQYSVVPSATAVRGNLVPRVGPAASARGYEVRAVPLQFIAPTEMEKLLQPYAREGAILKADNARALIMLGGTRRELENYLSTIEVFDVDWIKGMSIGLYTLEQVEAKVLGPELDQIFGEQSQSPLAGMFRFVPIERLNAILVITPQQRYLDEAERWIARLDKGGNQPGVRLYVYDVKNVKATDLADRLNDIFGGTGGDASRAATASAAGGVAPGLQPIEMSSSTGSALNLRSPTGEKAGNDSRSAPGTPPGGGSQPPGGLPPGGIAPGATAADGGLAIVEGEEIRITAVEENNQLIIRSTPGQYEAIRGAIRKLDSVPLQVHIEARLLDVSLTNGLQFGVQWYFEDALSRLAPPDVDDGDDDSGALKGAIRGDTFGEITRAGTNWIFAGRRAGALVSMLQNEGDVKVLSAPSVLVLNNTEASINVGQQIPVVSSSFVNPITQPGAGSLGQNQFQFRDTGIILNVKPRVNPGGLVFLEVQAEQSTPGPADTASEFGGNVPVDRKSIETEVAVQSGDTVLLGGLIQQNDSEAQSGMPGLMKIPVLGKLFGRTQKDNSRKELLVLITPTVIRGGAEDARELTEEYKKRFQGLSPLIRDMEAAESARRALQN